MKAFGITQYGELDQVKLLEVPKPEPLSNQVQIKIAFAGVNPVDWKICAGMLQTRLPYQFPIILGWDLAGTVSKIGDEVSNLQVGDQVFAYARSTVIHHGTFAEYICLDAKNVALKPKCLNFAQSAALPLVFLTAWQSLVENGKLSSGNIVFISAGAGGVGSLAIQIAHHFNATVITTARETNHDYLKSLGANYVIDYRKQNVVDEIKKIAPHGVDLVFDLMDGQNLEESYSIISRGGRLVSLLAQPDPILSKKYGVEASYVFVRPDGEQLKKLAKLFDESEFILPNIHEYSLEQAREALELVKTRHVQGKIVLSVR